tara:strand:+ start:151 stop:1071 length:921 start_codon:yes stop_codon:yes gene_type:complete
MSSALSVAAALSAANALKVLKKDQLKAEEKVLDTQYKNDQAIYNYNKDNMALTAQQQRLNDLYNKNFGPKNADGTGGRDASFGTKGGADYWLTEHNPQTEADWANIDRMLAASDEGVKYAASVKAGAPKVLPGGIDPTKSISSQSGWADHFKKGGVFENENAAGAITNIANDIGFTPSEAYFNNSVGGGNDNTGGGGSLDGDTKAPAGGWWTKFADADAFKKFLQPDAKADNGMGDFMKFMMLMNVMRPGGGMGGGGGSQYGYGGLNPGGVQSAYDPMASLTGMGDWFKKNFGSSSNTSTSTVNTN